MSSVDASRQPVCVPSVLPVPESTLYVSEVHMRLGKLLSGPSFVERLGVFRAIQLMLEYLAPFGQLPSCASGLPTWFPLMQDASREVGVVDPWFMMKAEASVKWVRFWSFLWFTLSAQ